MERKAARTTKKPVHWDGPGLEQDVEVPLSGHSDMCDLAATRWAVMEVHMVNGRGAHCVEKSSRERHVSQCPGSSWLRAGTRPAPVVGDSAGRDFMENTCRGWSRGSQGRERVVFPEARRMPIPPLVLAERAAANWTTTLWPPKIAIRRGCE